MEKGKEELWECQSRIEDRMEKLRARYLDSPKEKDVVTMEIVRVVYTLDFMYDNQFVSDTGYAQFVSTSKTLYSILDICEQRLTKLADSFRVSSLYGCALEYAGLEDVVESIQTMREALNDMDKLLRQQSSEITNRAINNIFGGF